MHERPDGLQTSMSSSPQTTELPAYAVIQRAVSFSADEPSVTGCTGQPPFIDVKRRPTPFLVLRSRQPTGTSLLRSLPETQKERCCFCLA